MFNTFLVQTVKELKEFRRDRLSVALAFLLPLFSLLLLGFGIRLESKSIPVVVRDSDNTSLSREYIARLYATNMFVPADADPKESLTRAIDRGEAKVAVEIPKGFTGKVFTGSVSPFKVYIDGTDISNVQVLTNSIEAANLYFLSVLHQTRQPDAQLSPVVPETRLWFNPGREERLFIVPGAFAIVLWMYPALLAAVAASREKEQGTMIRVYASNPNPLSFLLGKAAPYFMISLVMAIMVMTVGAIIFNVFPVGDPTPLIVSTPLYVLVSVLFGLMLGTYAGSQTTAVQATSSIGFFPCLLLSGFVYPISNIPFPLNLFAIVVPGKYFIELTRDAFVRGTGWSAVWYVPVVLILFCIVELGLSCMALRRMQEKD
ncbi:ABC transporter permease [Candidatus Obscuribacterales bacterium]|nr:ABC transporter permease [Candidatus Obscuribacterales bacterium]MBX3150942.1 ABC transporter permease [Candidatus Obscuribacterales bacterium]